MMSTSASELVVPTLPEMIGIKAFLAYSRNAVRDYLDFAALSTLADEDSVLTSLLRLDVKYAGLQTSSIQLEVAKALTAALPYDLEGADLSRYLSLVLRRQDWTRTEGICRHFGVLFAERMFAEDA